MVGLMIVAGVWTGVGFSNLKNCWTRIRTRVHKFWNKSRVGVWKSDSGVKRNFWLAKFLTSHHVCMDRVIFCIPNMLMKLIL